MILRLFIALVLATSSKFNIVLASGTALSNDRDLVRFDFHGGLASPLPGIGGGSSVVWTPFPADAFGLALDASMHSLDADDAKLATHSVDIVYEHTVAFFKGYHALRLRSGAGITRVHRAMDDTIARQRDREAERVKWASNAGASLMFDMPIADLMWFRIGVAGDWIFLKETQPKVSLFIGGVLGGQWFRIGD